MKTDDPRIVERYLSKLHTILEDHNLYERMDAVTEAMDYEGLTEELIMEYELIDKQRTKAMKIAEKNVGSYGWVELHGHPSYNFSEIKSSILL